MSDREPYVSPWVVADEIAGAWVRDRFPVLFQTPPARPDERELVEVWLANVGTMIGAVARLQALPTPPSGASLITIDLGELRPLLTDLWVLLQQNKSRPG